MMHEKMIQLFTPSQGLPVSSRSLAFYQEYEPSLYLRPYIACYWSVNTRTTGDKYDTEIRVVPDGCVDFVFTVGRNRACEGLLSGVMESAMTVHPGQNSTLFGVRFRPGGAIPFIRCPLSDLRGKSAGLTELFGTDAVKLFDRLANIDDFRKRIQVLDEILLEWFLLVSRQPFDNIIANVLHEIYRTSGNVLIHELADREAISPRQLLRRFEMWTGYSPKLFCRVIRFQKALSSIVRMQGYSSSADIAYNCGYADQAHFVREFSLLAGMSPGHYVRTAGMSDLFNTVEDYSNTI